MTIEIEFKAKVQDRQSTKDLRFYEAIETPELLPRHVVKGGPFNDLTLKMAIRRAQNRGWERPPKTIWVEDPPANTEVDTSGFLAVVRITVPSF